MKARNGIEVGEEIGGDHPRRLADRRHRFSVELADWLQYGRYRSGLAVDCGPLGA